MVTFVTTEQTDCVAASRLLSPTSMSFRWFAVDLQLMLPIGVLCLDQEHRRRNSWNATRRSAAWERVLMASFTSAATGKRGRSSPSRNSSSPRRIHSSRKLPCVKFACSRYSPNYIIWIFVLVLRPLFDILQRSFGVVLSWRIHFFYVKKIIIS